ncbi:MAG: hypothetical protein AB1921_01915 [Thermodesulfobacteriota bacterium]
MRKQPDFRELFFRFFGGKPRKVSYAIRKDSNRYHDLIMLNSLIHDGRFMRESIRVRGKRVSIPLRRDCWELPHVPLSENSAEMYRTEARLTLSPVSCIDWVFDRDMRIEKNGELMIESLWFYRDLFECPEYKFIVLEGFSWKGLFTVDDFDFTVRLTDLTAPYLDSEKKQRNQRPRD